MLGACGSCRWGRSSSRRPWPVLWRWCTSPFMRGYSLGFGNVLLMPILESTVRSSDYCGRTVVVARRHCPALGGWRNVGAIAGVSCVDRRVWRSCPDLWRS